ncbi:MAG: hypothetical protein ACRD0J_10570, partial [Acidimicrobiales bacterium]
MEHPPLLASLLDDFACSFQAAARTCPDPTTAKCLASAGARLVTAAETTRQGKDGLDGLGDELARALGEGRVDQVSVLHAVADTCDALRRMVLDQAPDAAAYQSLLSEELVGRLSVIGDHAREAAA